MRNSLPRTKEITLDRVTWLGFGSGLRLPGLFLGRFKSLLPLFLDIFDDHISTLVALFHPVHGDGRS